MKTFQHRVVVITGAGGGFGRALAQAAAALGMRLVLADVEERALQDAVDEAKSSGAEVLGQRCDVRHAHDVQALANATVARFGSVHLLFNNAGVGTTGLLWESSESDWEWVLGVNLWGVIHGVRIFTPLMINASRSEQGYEGHIINTASVAGLMNAPLMGIYNVSKHAVVSLSETLHHDLQLVGAPIGTSVLCPHFVSTGIGRSERNRPENLSASDAPTHSQVLSRSMLDKAIAGSAIQPAEVAACAFDAVRNDRFHVFTHPEAMQAVDNRMRDILERRNPSDPYEEIPAARAMLETRLRTA